MVERRRDIAGVVSVERSYYIVSHETISAERLARTIRGHWNIENALHWTLDVSFDEDRSRVRVGHGAQNMALIRKIALNLLKNEKTSKRGIKGKRLKAGWDEAYLINVLKAGI
jgi:predicted transposase YbfD/YdcC